MRRLVLLAVLVLAASCARRLAPIDVRTVTRVNEGPAATKDVAYSRALAWFESHDRSGIRVASSDPDTASISASAEMQCNSSVGAGLRTMELGFNQNYLR